MTVAKYVELECDENDCRTGPYGPFWTLGSARKQARTDGWWMDRLGDFCPAHNPARTEEQRRAWAKKSWMPTDFADVFGVTG